MRPPNAGEGPPTRAAVDALDALETELRAQLAAIGRTGPEAQRFAGSVQRALARQRAERVALRRWLGLLPARPAAAVAERDPDLQSLRAAQSDLAFACCDAIAAVGQPRAISLLTEHLRELAQQLAVVELWIEREQGGE